MTKKNNAPAITARKSMAITARGNATMIRLSHVIMSATPSY
ncbi:MAG: hypothetical protein QY325_04805 [Flavobacteriales bacterium]|nr:MAG: hypothetical protein QY325_04805 [Flavobacteriales bacterium]